MALAAAAEQAQAQPLARPTVAVDFAALDEGSYKRLDALALEERVVLRLAQEGFAVVVPRADPQILIRLRVLADRVVIEDHRGGAAGRREVITTDEPVRELAHLEIAQKIVELARVRRAALTADADAAAKATAAAAASRISAPPASENLPSLAATPDAPEGRAGGLEIGGGGAALWREGGQDPQVRVDVRFAPDQDGLGLVLGGAFAPASTGGVSVYEGQLQAGAGYRLWLTDRLALGAAVLAGGMLHRFSVEDPALRARSGTRFDFLASVPLTAMLAGSSVGIELRVAPGVAGGQREHTLGAQRLWQRGALRAEAGLALIWRIR
jgi:hypothetical protein